jgi:hypothetical protein
MGEKTVWKQELMVETISILPRTLEIKEEQMKVGDVNSQMYVVYGHDPATRRVWCATFIDEQEAEAWVHGSKTFGRPVLGAVMAGQEHKIEGEKAQQGAEMSDTATEGVDGGASVN